MVQKENGDVHRRKIRFRFYGYQPNGVKLEVKEKENQYTIKKSLSISSQEALDIASGDYSGLCKDSHQGQLIRLYDHMQAYHYTPSVIVDYERTAFVHPFSNIRINFDQNIRASHQVGQMFQQGDFFYPICNRAFTILEIKYDGYMPEFIKRILSAVELIPVSYSKYYYAKEYMF